MASDSPIDVACLVLRDGEGRVLATRRPPHKSLGGLWEFPGGKIDAGESPEAALRRELREELELEVGGLVAMPPVDHQYAFGTIRLWPLLGHCPDAGLPEMVLHEHTEARWVEATEARDLQWAPADLPVLDAIFTRA
ncbi:MAG: NUDIX domain-containing protein [Luteolibacter sp.]